MAVGVNLFHLPQPISVLSLSFSFFYFFFIFVIFFLFCLIFNFFQHNCLCGTLTWIWIYVTCFYWFDLEKIPAGKFSIKSWVENVTMIYLSQGQNMGF